MQSSHPTSGYFFHNCVVDAREALSERAALRVYETGRMQYRCLRIRPEKSPAVRIWAQPYTPTRLTELLTAERSHSVRPQLTTPM